MTSSSRLASGNVVIIDNGHRWSIAGDDKWRAVAVSSFPHGRLIFWKMIQWSVAAPFEVATRSRFFWGTRIFFIFISFRFHVDNFSEMIAATRAVDPQSIFADPDPAVFLNVDLDSFSMRIWIQPKNLWSWKKPKRLLKTEKITRTEKIAQKWKTMKPVELTLKIWSHI